MRKLINFFRGSVELEVTGAFPERFLNLCAQEYLTFWGIEWLDGGGLRITVARRDRVRAEQLGERAMCTVTECTRRGAPAFLMRFRRRYALLVGMALSLLAVCILSQFILWVEVEGNETVSTAEIITQLQRLGLRPGVYGPGVDESAVSRELLLRVDGLSWCAVNLRGTRAEVLVREAVAKPDVLDDDTLGDVVARAPGIVVHMEVLEGEPVVTEGSTVLEGELLIAGNIANPVPKYSEIAPDRRLVRAQGRVYARTWRTLTAQIPLTAQVKRYTGEVRHGWSLCLLGRRIDFYRNSGIMGAGYDKITENWTARLPNGRELPLALGRETFRAYETVEQELDAAAAQTVLEERLMAVLEQQVGDGEIVSTTWAAREADGVLTVTLTAECREEIGRFAPFPGASGYEG